MGSTPQGFGTNCYKTLRMEFIIPNAYIHEHVWFGGINYVATEYQRKDQNKAGSKVHDQFSY